MIVIVALSVHLKLPLLLQVHTAPLCPSAAPPWRAPRSCSFRATTGRTTSASTAASAPWRRRRGCARRIRSAKALRTRGIPARGTARPPLVRARADSVRYRVCVALVVFCSLFLLLLSLILSFLVLSHFFMLFVNLRRFFTFDMGVESLQQHVFGALPMSLRHLQSGDGRIVRVGLPQLPARDLHRCGGRDRLLELRCRYGVCD
jgi:hypothetical protein